MVARFGSTVEWLMVDRYLKCDYVINSSFFGSYPLLQNTFVITRASIEKCYKNHKNTQKYKCGLKKIQKLLKQQIAMLDLAALFKVARVLNLKVVFTD